jgi:hypothetical protein
MELIRQPNRWSCNACAWAMVLGLTLEEIVHVLGYDGQAAGGFDDEALTWLAVDRGFASTWLEVQPTAAPGSEPDPWMVERVRMVMDGRRGVLAVIHPEIPEGLHAVAWDGLRVYDPLLGLRPLHEYQLWGFHWIEPVEQVT